MIQKMEITGVHMKVEDKLHAYVVKKIARMDRYMPRRVRQSAHAEVLIKESKIKQRKQYTCEVVLKLPKDVIAVKETTLNPFAAVDIVEAKLKNQLKKYKETHSSPRFHRRLLLRLKRVTSRGLK